MWKSEFGLKEFTDKKHFKSYDQLKGRLDKVLGTAVPGLAAVKAADANLSEEEEEFNTSGAEDEDLDYFKSLANQN